MKTGDIVQTPIGLGVIDHPADKTSINYDWWIRLNDGVCYPYRESELILQTSNGPVGLREMEISEKAVHQLMSIASAPSQSTIKPRNLSNIE